MIAPDPENTGRNAPSIPLPPMGRGGYKTPAGQTVTPNGTTTPWDTGGPLGQLLQSLASSDLTSLFTALRGSGIGGATANLGDLLTPAGQQAAGQIVKALGGLYGMPQFNQVTGSFGSERQSIENLLTNFVGSQHQVGDPSQGRLPQTSQRDRPDLSSLLHPAVDATPLRTIDNWLRQMNAGYSPTHSQTVQGGPHPEWSKDDTDKQTTARDVHNVEVGAKVLGGVGAAVGLIAGFPNPVAMAEGAILFGAIGAFAGAVVGPVVGALHDRPESIRPDPRPHGGMPAPDDPHGGGPHSTSYFPSDEGGPVNPRSYAAMPAPDGGPGGPNWYPNPDDPVGVGPKARIG